MERWSVEASPNCYVADGPKEKEDQLDIENLDLDNNEDQVEDDTVLLEDESDIDPTTDVGIKPPEEGEEQF